MRSVGNRLLELFVQLRNLQSVTIRHLLNRIFKLSLERGCLDLLLALLLVLLIEELLLKGDLLYFLLAEEVIHLLVEPLFARSHVRFLLFSL